MQTVKWATVVGMLIAFVAPYGAICESKKPNELPPALAEIEKKYVKAETLVADFSQVDTVASLNQTKKSSGRIQIKRPDKLHWETLKPDRSLLVSNGKSFWYYTPPFDEGENGQLIVKKASTVQSRLANALLSGAFSSDKDLKIKAESASKFVLTPKRGTAGSVKQAEIFINPKDQLIEKVKLHHKGGNRTEISLSNIELGKTLPDSLFNFVPPPGTDSLDE